MEGTVTIEIKKSIIPFMAESWEYKIKEGPSMQPDWRKKGLPSGIWC
jgi:hypothetical protein